jgi:hypothetical protein
MKKRLEIEILDDGNHYASIKSISIKNGSYDSILIDQTEYAQLMRHFKGQDLECEHCGNKQILHSIATKLCPDRFSHFKSKT